MKSFAFVSLVAFTALVAGSAVAQTSSERDRAVARLTDGRDMSTSLPMNAPAIAAKGFPGGTERDRAIEKLTNARDMSTGFAR